MGKIAVITDEDVATFFRSSGVTMSYSAKTAKEAEDLAWKLSESKDIDVLVITERLADEIRNVVDEISKKLYPTVIIIPGKEGPIPGKVSPIFDLIKKTVGKEIKI